jgi:ABC-2 type transport system permease protein
MSRIWAIAVREVRAYFLSPIAYILLAAFLFLNGLVFYLILNAFSQPGAPTGSVMQVFLARNVFYWFFFLIFMAAITMRLFAEERRSGTLEILMTAPVTNTEAVLGKFLGAFFFYLALWAPTLLYVVILRRFSPIDLGPVASGYLYLVLVGAMFLSLGLLISIMTRSQIVASLVSFALMFLIFLVPIFFAPRLAGSARGTLGDGLHSILMYTDLWTQAGDFGKGIVDSRPLLYYASSTGVFLFLSVWALATRKGR